MAKATRKRYGVMSATLQILGSSSEANGYILTCGENKLILEAGCKPKEYLDALGYNIQNVNILCTHGHLDHTRSIPALLKYAIPIHSSLDVSSKYKGKVNVLVGGIKYRIGNFDVIPLRVPHGDCENFSYWIRMPDGQALLFATDLERFPYSIKGITHLMIECNFSNELILDSLVNGDILRSQSQNHLELEECIATVKRLRHGGLQSVILVHLSNGLSDIKMFKERFKSELGITPLIAESGKIFSLESCEF